MTGWTAVALGYALVIGVWALLAWVVLRRRS
jgi:hypothetical protein